MNNVYSGSSVFKKFLPAHLIYLLLCWGVIKCEPCGALWHGCVLWQHWVWPYGCVGVWIFLHTLVMEHPCYTYMLLCIQAELATASHLVFNEIEVCIKRLSLHSMQCGVIAKCAKKKSSEVIASWGTTTTSPLNYRVPEPQVPGGWEGILEGIITFLPCSHLLPPPRPPGVGSWLALWSGPAWPLMVRTVSPFAASSPRASSFSSLLCRGEVSLSYFPSLAKSHHSQAVCWCRTFLEC